LSRSKGNVESNLTPGSSTNILCLFVQKQTKCLCSCP
jgi:hypothetical protein